MFCPKCGSELRSDAQFCIKCGAKVGAEQNLRALIEEGKSLYAAKKFDKAQENFSKAAALDPKNLDAWYQKALVLKDWGIVTDDKKKIEQAIADFDRALQIDPKNAEIWYNKGLALGMLDQFEHAIESFDIALKLDPKNATYEMMLQSAREESRARKEVAQKETLAEKDEVKSKAERRYSYDFHLVSKREEEKPKKVEPPKAERPQEIIKVLEKLPAQYSILLTGAPGVGKFEFCLSMAKTFLERGENVVFITTERSPNEIKKRALAEGLDFEKYEGKKFIFIDGYSYSTGEKYDKGLHIDNPANLNLITINLTKAAEVIGSPSRIIFDSVSALFIHANDAEIKRFFGVLSSRVKTEKGFILYTIQEEMHSEQTVVALKAIADAVFEMQFEEGPPMKRKFRVHHAKGLSIPPTWYYFDVTPHGFKILGEAISAQQAARQAVVVEKPGVSKKLVVMGVLALLAFGGVAIFLATGNQGKVEDKEIHNIATGRSVSIDGKELPASISVRTRRDAKAPKEGWLIAEAPFYKIEINLDRPYYLIYDKLNKKDLLVYNDTVENPTDMLTGSSLGYADLDAVNMVPFSSMALHDASGIKYTLSADRTKGVLFVTLEGWDFVSKDDMRRGYDVESEEVLVLFADKPYFFDAIELNNLQKLGFAFPVKHRSPTEIVKDWVVTGDYDSAVVVGGDYNHLNKEFEEAFLQVQSLGGARKPWHTGSASFSKMFPTHVVIGDKLSGGVIFSLPEGKFRFNDALGANGAQVVLEFLISVEKPQKATAFAVDPVNRESFFYDVRDFGSVKGYPESMKRIMERYGLNYTGKPLDAQDWEAKRFAFVVTLTKDWYDAATNKPRESALAVANEGLKEFKVYEETLWTRMESTKPLAVKALSGAG